VTNQAIRFWDDFTQADQHSNFFGALYDTMRKLIQRWIKKLEGKAATESVRETRMAMEVYKKRSDLIVWCINIQHQWSVRTSNDKGAAVFVSEFDSMMRFAEAPPAVEIESPYVWSVFLETLACLKPNGCTDVLPNLA
jgi:hypothetical protein